MIKFLGIWAIIWIIIAIGVSAFGYGESLPGVAVAALISLFFVFKILNENWSGTVVEIKTETVYTSDEDGTESQDITYAYIKLDNGKTKKIQNMGWKVGDKLVKARGQAQIKIVS
ncbi:MAG TPA: hypothetical protein PK370_00860 [Candidatus Woesebacteria bacterium]|nr:hypothetical protein [Candidatus Woesebacteria bacterium]